jgi:hypothetical protein
MWVNTFMGHAELQIFFKKKHTHEYSKVSRKGTYPILQGLKYLCAPIYFGMTTSIKSAEVLIWFWLMGIWQGALQHRNAAIRNHHEDYLLCCASSTITALG